MKRYYFVIFLLLIAGLLAVVSSGNSTQDVRSRAREMVPVPAKIETKPPYIRLVEGRSSKDSVPVDVYVHTGGKPAAEVSIAISFDPSKLTLTKEDIVSVSLFPVFAVGRVSPGRVEASFFSDVEAGQPLVQTSVEKPLARIMFQKKKGTKGMIEIHVMKESSGLFTQEEGTLPVNILQSVEDLTISSE